MADDVHAADLHVCRLLYWAAIQSGHDGEADWYEHRIDELLHCNAHHDADMRHVLDDLARWQP